MSFARVLSGFNDHLHAYFLFIKELQNLPILHIIDVGTGFSATFLMLSTDMEDASRMTKTECIHVHAPPQVLSGDLECDNRVICRLCADAEVEHGARHARRHNKIGSVDSANATINLLVQRLLIDYEHQSMARGTKKLLYEILFRATFLKHVLYGGMQGSSFELARSFTPSLCGMRQSPLSGKALRSHQEQVSRCAVQKLMLSHPAHLLTKTVLPGGAHVYFYVKSASSASRMREFLLRAGLHACCAHQHQRRLGWVLVSSCL